MDVNAGNTAAPRPEDQLGLTVQRQLFEFINTFVSGYHIHHRACDGIVWQEQAQSVIICCLTLIIRRFEQDGVLVYHAAIEQMKLNESTTLLIDFTHVLAYSEALAQAIQNEYYR